MLHFKVAITLLILASISVLLANASGGFPISVNIYHTYRAVSLSSKSPLIPSSAYLRNPGAVTLNRYFVLSEVEGNSKMNSCIPITGNAVPYSMDVVSFSAVAWLFATFYG